MAEREFYCESCDREFKNISGLKGHNRTKHAPTPVQAPAAAPVAEAVPEAPAPSAPLKTIPGFSQGVRVNSAMRMLKLAAPICPNSQRKQNSDGTFAEIGQNCQLADGEWWVECERLGHDPYFTTRTYYEPVDILDEEGFVVGTKKKAVTVKRPNIVQVPVARRMHNGNGVVESMRRKGRRRLGAIGFAEVCQFRNCQNPVNPKAVSTAFGAYCSREHLQLIAADDLGMFLPQVTGPAATFLEGGGDRARNERAEMLRRALASATVE